MISIERFEGTRALMALEEARRKVEEAIARTPTSELRNSITEVNMLLISVIETARTNWEKTNVK